MICSVRVKTRRLSCDLRCTTRTNMLSTVGDIRHWRDRHDDDDDDLTLDRCPWNLAWSQNRLKHFWREKTNKYIRSRCTDVVPVVRKRNDTNELWYTIPYNLQPNYTRNKSMVRTRTAEKKTRKKKRTRRRKRKGNTQKRRKKKKQSKANKRWGSRPSP